jgi:hypothetical protein
LVDGRRRLEDVSGRRSVSRDWRMRTKVTSNRNHTLHCERLENASADSISPGARLQTTAAMASKPPATQRRPEAWVMHRHHVPRAIPGASRSCGTRSEGERHARFLANTAHLCRNSRLHLRKYTEPLSSCQVNFIVGVPCGDRANLLTWEDTRVLSHMESP